MRRVLCALLYPASFVTWCLLCLLVSASAQQPSVPQPPPDAGKLLNETRKNLPTLPKGAPRVDLKTQTPSGPEQPGGERFRRDEAPFAVREH